MGRAARVTAAISGFVDRRWLVAGVMAEMKQRSRGGTQVLTSEERERGESVLCARGILILPRQTIIQGNVFKLAKIPLK